MNPVIMVMGGGALGSLLRYCVNSAVSRTWPAAVFPWATFTVNVVGCLMIGFLAGLGEQKPFSYPMKIFLLTGVLGGFTTFSAFGLESFALIKDGHLTLALINLASQIIMGLVAVGVGFALGSRIFP